MLRLSPAIPWRIEVYPLWSPPSRQEGETVKFIQIIRTADSPSSKTQAWDVRTKDGIGEHLGAVKWFGRWRCYAFYPGSGSIYEKTCLRDIAEFCETETRKRRG